MSLTIVRVVASLNSAAGGVSEGVLKSSLALASLGFKVIIVSFDSPPYPPHPVVNGLTITYLGPSLGKYLLNLGAVSALKAVFANAGAVIIEGIWQYHSFASWLALRDADIPYFVYTHGMLDPWFKRTYPLKHLKKWFYWPWADYRVLRDATAVLFTTDQERLLARETFWLYKAKEVVVGYGTSVPPADLERQQAAFLERFPHLRGQRTLLFLSRIHPKKGVDLLIEAFAAVAGSDPRLQLVIAGPDQVGLQAQLQQRADALGIADRITWPGMLSGELKWGAFRAAELFCLPSHQENFGIVVAEALACGLPVAIAEPVNISTEIAQAGAGIVHADTAAATTAALQQWLATTPAARAEMGARGRKLFADRFDFASVARNLIPVLESAMKERSVR